MADPVRPAELYTSQIAAEDLHLRELELIINIGGVLVALASEPRGGHLGCQRGIVLGNATPLVPANRVSAEV